LPESHCQLGRETFVIEDLPVVILAGGLGTRLREETETKPKPMVEIGGYPILWHIMKYYASFGSREFVICLGYKGEKIKDFFLSYQNWHSSMTVDLRSGEVIRHDGRRDEPWTVHLLDTGLETMTGGRIGRAARFLGARRFMATYGDGLADIDIAELLASHVACSRRATLTATRPPARFGGLEIEGECVKSFTEKPQIGEGWINGGFMVFEPGITDFIVSDETILEREPLETLSREGQLNAFRHDGFWQPMDTLRDITLMRDLWDRGNAPWKRW